MAHARKVRLVLSVLGVVIVSLALAPEVGAPVAAACTYRAGYISDVSVLDNTAFAPGTPFVKTWRIKNTGTCPWGPGTTVDAVVASGGTNLAGDSVVPLTSRVPAGATVEISVPMTAPASPGSYRSDWKLRRAGGSPFGLGANGAQPFYAKIVVASAAADIPQDAVRINFAGSATVTAIQDAVTAPALRSYVLRARTGQRMTVAVVSANNRANFSVVGVSDGQTLKRLVNEERYWTAVLPATQDYLLRVGVPGGSSYYALSIAVAP
jgi:hypothetical protein